MCVVEVASETEQRDDGRELVEDKERRYVRDRGIAESIGVLVQKLWQAAIEALDARLGGRWRGWRFCRIAARVWAANELWWARSRPQDGSL